MIRRRSQQRILVTFCMNFIPGMISILLPTRNRPQNLLRLFESLKATTLRLDLLEIVFYVDDDDFSEGIWGLFVIFRKTS